MSWMDRELEREEDAIMQALADGELTNREAQRELNDLRHSFEAAVEREAEQAYYETLDYYGMGRP